MRTSDGRHVTLAEEVVFTRPKSVGGQRITILAGATSDGASTPAMIWSKLPPYGDYWLAALLHDAAYRMQTRPVINSRSVADLLLYEGCIALGVPEHVARTLYNAVLIFGGLAWKKDRNLSD